MKQYNLSSSEFTILELLYTKEEEILCCKSVKRYFQ